MARYTLKTFCGTKLVETYQHRSGAKLLSILSHSRFHSAVVYDDYGNIVDTPNKFEIFDSQMSPVFSGTISDTMSFVRSL